jgi:TonB-dependent SusC/RagA subfamily outer membrane receptor
MRNTITKIRVLMVIGILLLSTGAIDAQNRIVHGIVTTFDSIPLSGASIKIKSTKQVVYTDSVGRFSVGVNAGDLLRVDANGFFPQKVRLEEKTRFAAVNLKLKSGEKNRKYAIGYGHVTDAEKLNALANLNNDDLDFSQYRDLYDLIKGRFSGVQIINGEIIIRGVNSINASSAALIIVDDVPVDGSTLGTIPPTQVQSINIIKDGSSAIYGSRGANGVVLIETKRGGN